MLKGPMNVTTVSDKEVRGVDSALCTVEQKTWESGTIYLAIYLKQRGFDFSVFKREQYDIILKAGISTDRIT